MVDHSKPLTHEQQQFAEEHHDVIYSFLRANRLPECDYYDVVVFGYINAVRKYTERPELRDFSFTTIAFWTMRTSLSNEKKKQARRIQPISLDAENEDGLDLYGLIGVCDPDPDEAGGQYNAQYADLLSVLTRTQRKILTMKAQGLTDREIAEILGLTSAGAVSNIAYRARKALQQAERARTEQLKQKVDERIGQSIPLEDFAQLEVDARRKLATYKTNHPTYRRKDSALVKIIASAIFEPAMI